MSKSRTKVASFSSSSSSSSSSSLIDPSLLAKAWTPRLLELEDDNDSPVSRISKAAERTLPLLEDAASVPFVCRYRTDVIDPLTTRQVHLLQSLRMKHASLESLRCKLLQLINNEDEAIRERIITSTSKTELEDWYAPFKPPAKGSILERIRSSHPQLVEAVDQLWSNNSNGNHKRVELDALGPRAELVQILSTKIAADPNIALTVTDELRKHCRITTTCTSDPNYRAYDNFSGQLARLKDYQVLAIRRGVQQKAIQMNYDVDATKLENCIKYQLRVQKLAPKELIQHPTLLTDSVHDAWTRLLRRRGTSRLWTETCKRAQERACQVFEDNLRRALLAPPLVPESPVLALDPGFQAGIKCALLNDKGAVMQLETIQFLGPKRESALAALQRLVKDTKDISASSRVLIALGNGHGSQDCKVLVLDAVRDEDDLEVDFQLVNEAGASVWSVTETARAEFPDHPPSAIAAISIGRRLQNPLFELVKVPPKSLGLGMYQHDMSEKELDEKLQLTSIDAVATVGVEVNSCSLEILQQVPGLQKLAEKIIQSRPIQTRADLLKIPRLGAKTFENCAAFCRIQNGPEPLDATLVHPESYDLARWLLQTLGWKLSDGKPLDLPPTPAERKEKWGKHIHKASKRFGVTEDRVMAVLENLVDSIMNVDPRLKDADLTETVQTTAGSVDKCSTLPPELADISKLASAVPVRSVIGTIRNIVDFGAFIDVGAENDGLLHTSKLGPLNLSNLLIGQPLGVDILNVTNGKLSLGVAGLNQQPSSFAAPGAESKNHQDNNNKNNNMKRSGSKRSMSTTKEMRTKGQKRQKTR